MIDKAHTHPVLAFVNGCYIRLLFLRVQTVPIPSKDAVRMMDSSFGCVAIEQTGLWWSNGDGCFKACTEVARTKSYKQHVPFSDPVTGYDKKESVSIVLNGVLETLSINVVTHQRSYHQPVFELPVDIARLYDVLNMCSEAGRYWTPSTELFHPSMI